MVSHAETIGRCWFPIEITDALYGSLKSLKGCPSLKIGHKRTYEERVEVGEILWKTLFGGSKGKEFTDELRKSKEEGTLTRILLDFKCSDSRQIDWEILYNPEKKIFLVEDDYIEIIRSPGKVLARDTPSLEIPLQIMFVVLGGDKEQYESIVAWLTEALGALAETGAIKPRFETFEKFTKLEVDKSIQLFHLIMLDTKQFKIDYCDQLYSVLPTSAIGIISLIDENPSRGVELIHEFYLHGCPIFARIDLYNRDLQDQLAVRDLYFALAGSGELITRLNWVHKRQIDFDVELTQRNRVIQFFAITDQPVFPLEATSKSESPLQRYLRSEIFAQEKFYQWEKMYAELMFTTRLRLRKIDLSEERDLRSIEDRIYHLAEALQDMDSLVIIGEPGSGKTTACRRASWELAKESFRVLNSKVDSVRPRIPIYLELKAFSVDAKGGQRGLVEAILEKLTLNVGENKTANDTLTSFFKAHRLVLLLDGLNEVSPREQRREVMKEIFEIQQHFEGKLKLVVTSRKHDFEVSRFRNNGFEVLEIVELTDEDIRNFASCYLFDEKSVERFVNGLTRPLRTAARNPLMLRLLLGGFKKNKSLIGSRAQLLRSFCRDAMKNPCDVLFPDTLDVQLAKKEAFLTDVAYELWNNGFSLRAPKDKWLEIAGKSNLTSAIAEKLIPEIAANGIITIDYEDQKEIIEFRFQSYHEFFCARRLANKWMNGERHLIERLIHKESWHEIIALSAGVIEFESEEDKTPGRQSERQLIEYLKKKRKIILSGMCIWNMEKMNQELEVFEKWLVRRAEDSVTVMDQVASVALFYIFFPIWIFTLFMTALFSVNSNIFLWQYGLINIGTRNLTSFLTYLLVPIVLYYIYRHFSRWIALRQEALVLRPTLTALFLIGSDYARAAINDVISAERLYPMLSPTERVPLIESDEGNVKNNILASLRAFLEPYRPEMLLRLVKDETTPAGIQMLAKVVAKEVSVTLMRQLAQLAQCGELEIEKKALIAGNTIVRYNRELEDEWKSLMPPGTNEQPSDGTSAFIMSLLRSMREQFFSASVQSKNMAITVLMFFGILIMWFLSRDWKWAFGILLPALYKVGADYLFPKKST